MNLTINVIQWNGTGNPPIDLTVDIGGIIINGTSNVAPSATLTVSVDDGQTADISVDQSTYHPYSVEISNVYNTDKTIYIIMVPVRDIGDPDYNRPNSMLFTFNSPCGFKVDFYNASSFVGDVKWYINNEYYSTGLTGSIDYCNAGKYQIKQRTITYYTDNNVMWDRQWANTDEPLYVYPGNNVGQGETGNVIAGAVQPISTYLEIDLETNITVNEYRPDFTIDISSPVNQLIDLCCYTRGETVLITPSYNINKDNAVLSDYNIRYEIIDPDGYFLELQVDTFPLTSPNIEIDFDLLKLGKYIINATLIDLQCSVEFTVTKEVETCNFIYINETGCNNFEFVNKSSNKDVTITISEVTEQETEVFLLEPGQARDVAFSIISLYTVTAVYINNAGEETIEIYVLNNYCAIEDCLGKYIKDLLCVDKRLCKPCPDETELNQMMLLFYSYFNKLNTVYGWNNFYAGLDDSLLNDINELKINLDRILEFCKRRNCITSTSSASMYLSDPYQYSTDLYTSSTPIGCKTCGS